MLSGLKYISLMGGIWWSPLMGGIVFSQVKGGMGWSPLTSYGCYLVETVDVYYWVITGYG